MRKPASMLPIIRYLLASCSLLLGAALPVSVWAAAGDLDATYMFEGTYGVEELAMQPDGKLLVGSQYYLKRVNVDGSMDRSFDQMTISYGANGSDTVVRGVFLQPDGKILVGGNFNDSNGTGITRLNSDGMRDSSFNSATGGYYSYQVNAFAMQPDGKVLVGGSFPIINGAELNNIARLNSNGSLDSSFNSGTGTNGSVEELALQPDGKVLIVGSFTAVNGVAHNRIARLNSDGSLDAAFNPDINSSVNTLALQPDGKLVIGGNFNVVNGVSKQYIARLNADGSLDTTFNSVANNVVVELVLQPDGKIFLGGFFTSVNAVTSNRIARLNSDGSLDTSFNSGSGFNYVISAMAIQPDGRIFFAGNISTYNSVNIGTVARVHTGDLDADGVEDAGDFFPSNAAAGVDLDHDGLPDQWAQPNAYGCTANTPVCNGLTLDLDGDNDGVPNATDNCLFITNADQLDSDSDGTGNACDSDLDNDGDTNYLDKFPLNVAASADADNDHFPDAWNAVCNTTCQANSGLVLDNCPTTYNVNQLDTDHDGMGDACDTDLDNDGLLNTSDNCPLIANTNQKDSDFDGTGDVCDASPLAANAGARDTVYNIGSGPNSTVLALAQQPDGKLIIGGYFTAVNGVARNRIARLNSDGSLDAGFNPGTGANDRVIALAVQPDGKILLGGAFSQINGVARSCIARLNSDGSLDAAFNPNTSSVVNAMAIQSDGKVVIVGAFTSVNTISRSHIARLNTDGSLDSSFIPVASNSWAYAVAIQPDGKILMGGQFTTVNVTHTGLVRFNSDGSLDTSFSPSSPNIYSLAVQFNGKILIGGSFSAVNGVARYCIARLNSDGSLDTGFPSGYGADGQVRALAIQTDNKIVLVGAFSSINSVPRKGIARLNVDGSLDASFDSSSTNVTGNALAVQADGKLVLGGSSTANYIVRYHSGDADADGVEDATDTNDTPDIDGDGVPNSQDAFRNNAAASADANYDGLPDYWLEPNPYGCSPVTIVCNGLMLDSNPPPNSNPPPMPLNGNYKGSTVNERVNL